MITVKINEEEITRALNRVALALTDMTPLMQDLGDLMIDSTRENFTRAHAAVDVFWDASGIAETIKGIAIECQKRETEEEVWSGTVLDVERGQMTIQPVPPLTNLRVRAKALSDNRRGIWSAWIWVTSDDVRIQSADLADTLRDRLDTAFDRHDAVLGAEGTPQSVLDLLGRVDLETPQLRGIGVAVQQIEDRLVELDLGQFGLSRRLTDAGVYVEPSTGTVRIAGLDTTQERQSVVEANLDALAATLTLKASLTEVNDAIAAAQLGEADLAALTELQVRVSDVEVALDAAAGTLTLLSDTLSVGGALVSMTSVTGRLDSVEGTLTLKVDQSTFDAAEARLGDAEILLSSMDAPSIAFTVADQRRLRAETGETDDAVAEGLLRGWLDGQAARTAAASGRRELTAFVSEGLEAEASERLSLAAEVGEAQAQITSLAATRVTESGAIAAVNQTISASYGDLTALASATAFAQATVNGIAAGYVMRLNGDNVWEVVSVADGTGGPVVTGRWSGSYLRLDGDVEVTGEFLADKIFTPEAVIGRLTVTDELIAPNAVSRRAVFPSTQDVTVTATSSLAPQVISFPVDADFLPYDTEVNPSNPVIVTISGVVAPLTADPTRLVIGLQGRVGEGDWQTVSISLNAAIFAYDGRTRDFSVQRADMGTGQDAPSFSSFRLVAWLTQAAPFTGTSATVGSIVARLEQINK